MLHQGPENPEYNEATSNHSFARLYALDCMDRRALQLHLNIVQEQERRAQNYDGERKRIMLIMQLHFRVNWDHRGGRDICVFREHGAARNPVEN
jgi:hypothetical protein